MPVRICGGGCYGGSLMGGGAVGVRIARGDRRCRLGSGRGLEINFNIADMMCSGGSLPGWPVSFVSWRLGKGITLRSCHKAGEQKVNNGCQNVPEAAYTLVDVQRPDLRRTD